MASPSRGQHTPRPREPIHRPHSPKNPPSSAFSTVDLDETDTEPPVVPRRLRKRTVPKIVESAFGRNEQSSPVRPSQLRTDSSPGFDLLVKRRAARKAEASRHLEAPNTGNDMTWEELQELRRNTPEPGPSSPSTSKRGSVEPRGSSPLSPHTSRSRPRPPPSNTIDATERKMIEAREELSKVALRFRTRLPHSSLGSKSPDTGMNDDETHPLNESTHPFDETSHPFNEPTRPFDETTHPFDETTHPFDETTHPFDDSQVRSQGVHPFNEDSCIPSQETHPFDEDTQLPPDSTAGGQSHLLPEVGPSDVQIGASPVPSTPGSSKRRTDAYLITSVLESRNGRHSRTPSHPPPVSPSYRLRPGVLCSPNRPPRSPQNTAAHRPATPDGPLRGLKILVPIATSRTPPQSPRLPAEGVPILSPQRPRARGASPEDGRPKSTVTQELRELLENSPRTRRTPANVEVQPDTHGEA